MLDTIIFRYGTLVPVLENEFKWMKKWALLNKKEFNFSSPLGFKKYCDLVYSQNGFEEKNIYENLDLPYVEDEEFNRQHDLFHERSFNLYDGIPSIIPGIKKEGEKHLEFFGTRLRMGITSFYAFKNVKKTLEDGNIFKYFDSILTKRNLKHYFPADLNFSLEKSLSVLFYLLGGEGKKTLFVTDEPLSLMLAKHFKKFRGRKIEKLIVAGAGWTGCKGDFLKKQKTPEGEILRFDEVFSRPRELREFVRLQNEK